MVTWGDQLWGGDCSKAPKSTKSRGEKRWKPWWASKRAGGFSVAPEFLDLFFLPFLVNRKCAPFLGAGGPQQPTGAIGREGPSQGVGNRPEEDSVKGSHNRWFIGLISSFIAGFFVPWI